MRREHSPPLFISIITKTNCLYVLRGTLGALLGDEVVRADPGTWVFKPREQWHTFWNDGDTPCEIIEIISPAGFEQYFREVAAAWGDMARFAEINSKYTLEMDFDSVPRLCERFGVTFPQISDGSASLLYSDATLAAVRGQVAGPHPVAFLNARLNAGSDS